MIVEQKCVRTYDREGYKERSGCEDLNSYLKYGWKIVMVTPKPDYNEYIIEREVDTSRREVIMTEEKVEKKLQEVLKRFSLENLSKNKNLMKMCQNCESWCGKDHNYEECKDRICFKFFLAYFYLFWETSWE